VLIRDIKVPAWSQPSTETSLEVHMSADALSQLRDLEASGACLECLQDWRAVPAAVAEVLRADPRSVYRSDKCQDKPYFFYFDVLDVKCLFKEKHVEVVSITLVPPEERK